MAGDGHWVRWHAAYEDADSALSRRLRTVQRRLGEALENAREGPLRLVSMCAGQGRDVIEVLADHRRGADVAARLVELDPGLAAAAQAGAASAGLPGIEVLQGDASNTAAYADAVPADVVMVCGVFGNVSDDDIRDTVFELPRLSASDATVIWTRHRRPPDLTSAIRAWFVEAGFDEVAFDGDLDGHMSVGTDRFTGEPQPFRPGRRMFTFSANGPAAS